MLVLRMSTTSTSGSCDDFKSSTKLILNPYGFCVQNSSKTYVGVCQSNKYNSYADAGMHTPMLRMVHSVTAINSATPLLLNARNSSNTMPMYPSANTIDMATFWEFQHHRSQKPLISLAKPYCHYSHPVVQRDFSFGVGCFAYNTFHIR